jgi:hypothetical protein
VASSTQKELHLGGFELLDLGEMDMQEEIDCNKNPDLTYKSTF